jgi:uracil-DNA glycosylase
MDFRLQYENNISRFKSLNFTPNNTEIQIEYAPFDLIPVNKEARVLFLGLTPGRYQADQANKIYNEAKSFDDFLKGFRKEVVFDGSMKKNIIKMLDEAGLPEYLSIDTTADLFGAKAHLAEMSSLLKMPVFYKSKNYSGSPKPFKNDALISLFNEYTKRDLELYSSEILIIPFGKTVQESLEFFDISSNRKMLNNFPHPSGANGHRLRIFNKHKSDFKKILMMQS